MGVVYGFGDTLTTAATSIWVLVAHSAVFFALATLNIRRASSGKAGCPWSESENAGKPMMDLPAMKKVQPWT